ncbi:MULTISPECIES: branched-chain amino acid ABC transporter permease [unclassified Beijerinckia]|uniref:branched-chain amino acid ABC transporter permease n=1 Tax=unclassified Beijerinckia TaxID=2638183 RepID=UPI00089CC631|nr:MULTISPECIES: branched-chain amino acid ABC transporter permease [unclassified Beijerinckia]MDH7796161.1 branched-chain amino acid transport system permease protein [Beijerinckia sp. GAS462]SEC33039.1 amino acid/amide ABC transporter membrane protein 1, HAAT family [Beijerinckia sp. 28-YEA-48]
MSATLLLEQCLNGMQLGIMLFLMSAGLTLVFGIMNLVNLAHGSFYMVGAYLCAFVYASTQSFLLGVLAGLGGALAIGLIAEVLIFRRIYKGDHLDHVLVTFGLTLIFNDLVRLIWGPAALFARVPNFLAGQINLFGLISYPAYRLAIIIVGLAVAVLLYLLLRHTRLGMLIRASASNRTMASALGVNVVVLYALVFTLGAGLAGLAGLMAGPIFTVIPGMGDNVLILAFVVIVVGGLGSVEGAFCAALIIGLIDTLGRSFMKPLFGLFLDRAAADNSAPAIASMLIYILMAIILFLRPQGLFPPKSR